MENINKPLERVVKMPSFLERFEKLKQEVLAHPKVKQFAKEHEEQVTDELLERSLTTLQEYIDQSTGCCGAGSTGQCTNLQGGFYPKLIISNNSIGIQYVPCQQRNLEFEQMETKKLMQSFSISPQILSSTIQEIDYDSEARLAVGRYMAKIKEGYQQTKNLPVKGLYIHGLFGTGKSYVLGAIANEFVKMRVHTFIVYVPELIVDLKSSIRTGEFEHKMENLKKIPVLILDDLGAEVNTEWSRDEVIGTIINYRMMHELPIFVSSNLSYEQLERYYSNVTKAGIDPIKGARIVQRIQALTYPIEFNENRKRK